MEPLPTTNNTQPETPEPLALTLDVEKYLSQLEDWDISPEQKTEFIQTLWNILVSFAELGFEIHPAQLAQKAGELSVQKPPKLSEKPRVLGSDMLCFNPISSARIASEYNTASTNDARKESE